MVTQNIAVAILAQVPLAASNCLAWRQVGDLTRGVRTDWGSSGGSQPSGPTPATERQDGDVDIRTFLSPRTVARLSRVESQGQTGTLDANRGETSRRQRWM
jgi:hypothetical protein